MRPSPLLLAACLAIVAACGDDPAAPSPPAESDAGGSQEPSSSSASASDAEAATPVVIDCPPGSAVEREDNDTEGRANAFAELAFCGALSTPTDVDFATFVVPEGKKLMVFQAVIDGKVDFDLTAGGKTFQPGDVDAYVGGTYLVKAYTKAGKEARYRYRIQFE